MKERSILIADRRQAREERKKRKEKEREVGERGDYTCR